jgi:hypothetical protein
MLLHSDGYANFAANAATQPNVATETFADLVNDMGF